MQIGGSKAQLKLLGFVGLALLGGLMIPFLGSAALSAQMGYGVSYSAVVEMYQRVPALPKIMGPIVLMTLCFFWGWTSLRRQYERGIYEENRRKYAEDLEKRNAALLELNETMDSLVYTASHDLKTPVVNFKGLLKMLRMVKDRPDSEAMVNEIIDKLDISADRFMTTIGNLLDVSRIEQQQEIEREQVEIEGLLREVMEDMEEQMRRSGAKIKIDTDNAPQIMAVRQDLRSMMQNLLSNALKYTEPLRIPQISIRSHLADASICITVSDNGQGIDLKRHGEKLFQMFSRLHDGSGGNGVGLYIVRRTIEKAGGKISVESEPGKGATFQLSFPETCIP